MKITQEQTFNPITIVIETREEADYLWHLCEIAVHSSISAEQSHFIRGLCDWFSNKAKL